MTKNHSLRIGGVDVDMVTLWQTRTYAGMLEGTPNERINRRFFIEPTKARAQKEFPNDALHVIPPAVTPRPEWGNPMGQPAETIPDVTCIALFSSSALATTYSRLVVCFWQSDFALPFDTIIENEFKTMNWQQLARDFSHLDD